jgi:hypothetical protein
MGLAVTGASAGWRADLAASLIAARHADKTSPATRTVHLGTLLRDCPSSPRVKQADLAVVCACLCRHCSLSRDGIGHAHGHDGAKHCRTNGPDLRLLCAGAFDSTSSGRHSLSAGGGRKGGSTSAAASCAGERALEPAHAFVPAEISLSLLRTTFPSRMI